MSLNCIGAPRGAVWYLVAMLLPHPRLLPLALPLLLACADEKSGDPGGIDPGLDTSPDVDDTGDDDPIVDEPDCAEAEARLGYPACEPRIPDAETFEAVTLPAGTVDQIRVGKYLVPAVADARVPPVFLYVNAFPLHYEFLTTAFPDEFTGLTVAEYEALVLNPGTREFYGGTFSLYLSSDGPFYGFTVWDNPADTSTTVTQADVTAAYTTLQERFNLDTLAWVPYSAAQAAAAETWVGTPFDIIGVGSDIEYEAYNPAVGYGSLRLYDLADFTDASLAGEFSYQDIVVIDMAPSDIERVVSGIVTGTRQGDLSHLNVRSLARGTPNCFVKEPLTKLADWADKLVRFECGEESYTIEEATPEQATAFWDALRPDPVVVCDPDAVTRTFPGLFELPTDSPTQRANNVCTYGSKGSNLAALYQRIDPVYQLDGFLLPMSYYLDFVNTGTWTVDLGSGEGTYTFQETLDAWIADPEFQTDGGLRSSRLLALQSAMHAAPVDDALIAALGDRILEVFGSDTVMVRLRSSSNAEDSLGFSGAGLYDSSSVCLADELDGDSVGPSRCDPDKDDERTIRDGIRETWASLWNNRAWEERAWYGVDPSKVAMGILVNTRSNDEQANAVAFSGNPTDISDGRYLINAQEGELEVVSADPGVTPERLLVTVVDGEVTDVDRLSESSEVPAGEVVLDEVELAELAAVLFEASLVFPQDDTVPEGNDVIWDTEWKVDTDGQVKIKQIRPYLR